MGFLEKAFGDIRKKMAQREAQKRADQELMRRMELEAKVHERIAYEKAFRENAKIVAEANAKKRAAESSGIQKLRAMNRVRNLASNRQAPGGPFSRIAEYTQRNLANREENIKRTKEIRSAALKERQDKLANVKVERQSRMTRANSFGTNRRF